MNVVDFEPAIEVVDVSINKSLTDTDIRMCSCNNADGEVACGDCCSIS